MVERIYTLFIQQKDQSDGQNIDIKHLIPTKFKSYAEVVELSEALEMIGTDYISIMTESSVKHFTFESNSKADLIEFRKFLNKNFSEYVITSGVQSYLPKDEKQSNYINQMVARVERSYS